MKLDLIRCSEDNDNETSQFRVFSTTEKFQI